MNFKQITLADKEWMKNCLAASQFQGCDYSFANLYMWRKISQIEVAEYGGMLCIRSKRLSKGPYVYTFPAGEGNLKEVIEAMRQNAKQEGHSFILRGFTETQKEKVEMLFPGEFLYQSNREEWDYLYAVSDLTNLAGKKYHGKRNHIARFVEKGEWRLDPITDENKAECMRMLDNWYEKQRENDKGEALLDRPVLEVAFENYEVLELRGAALYLNDEIVGVTVGEPLNADTFVVHIEKAFGDIQGAYPMLNKQFVTAFMQGFTYVNREEDDGEPGLRRAKESYYPVKMIEKYCAYEKGENT